MGLFDKDGLTREGYGGPQLTDWGVIESRLSGIGQTTHEGITGRTATEAVERYRATGAPDYKVQQFAEGIARKYGR